LTTLVFKILQITTSGGYQEHTGLKELSPEYATFEEAETVITQRKKAEVGKLIGYHVIAKRAL
jgi:hypothetical protein